MLFRKTERNNKVREDKHMKADASRRRLIRSPQFNPDGAPRRNRPLINPMKQHNPAGQRQNPM